MAKKQFIGVQALTKAMKLIHQSYTNKFREFTSSQEFKNDIDNAVVAHAEMLNFAGDFLTEEGYRNLRFWQGKFQYFDASANEGGGRMERYKCWT